MHSLVGVCGQSNCVPSTQDKGYGKQARNNSGTRVIVTSTFMGKLPGVSCRLTLRTVLGSTAVPPKNGRRTRKENKLVPCLRLKCVPCNVPQTKGHAVRCSCYSCTVTLMTGKLNGASLCRRCLGRSSG